MNWNSCRQEIGDVETVYGKTAKPAQYGHNTNAYWSILFTHSSSPLFRAQTQPDIE